MISGFLKRSFLIKKAAQKCVAFFIFFLSSISYSNTLLTNYDPFKISELKKTATELLLRKDRSAAVDLINKAIASYRPHPKQSVDILENLYSLKENVLTVFLTQEAQDAYEASASTLFQNPRLSEKMTQACLAVESTNLYCRWQYLKYLNYKNNPQFQAESETFIKDSIHLPIFSLLAATLRTDVPPTQDVQTGYEKHFPVIDFTLQFERSLTVKNYSLSKDILQKLSALASDYPDLTLMRAKLAELSAETSQDDDSALLYKIYKKNCATLSAELTRKYFYDINLCHRGL